MCSTKEVTYIKIDESRYDQDTYWGRVKQIFQRYNPLNIFACADALEEAKCLYIKYTCGEPLPVDISEEELWRAKSLYESAYNPETGEKISFMAKPASQIYANAVLVGGLEAFYNSTFGVVIWHWLNQTYNSFGSYTNKGSEVTDNQLMTSYALATGTAVATALGLNHILQARAASCLVRRFVPFLAVSAAHFVSTPFTRAQMLKNGAPFYDESNTKLGHSKRIAQSGISGVILSKILYAAPPMVLTPFFMNFLEFRGTLCRYPWVNFPASAACACVCLTFLSPLTLAILSPRVHYPYKHLEPELREYLCKKYHDRPPKYVYYNNESLY